MGEGLRAAPDAGRIATAVRRVLPAQRCSVMGLVAALSAPAVHAEPVSAGELVDLPLEQLGNIVVTSVSRREEPLSNAPASIYVITAEDIRRSGANTLPEALRLAPNLQVARADATQYAISARGFNNVLANKLLVMIDGRTVYSPLFSGVFWESQDVMLEDVERIEVISGPGTTLWGANAVNGVINVITRSARDTQGALATAGAGTIESGGGARYGAQLGHNAFVRFYGKYLDQDNTERTNGTPVRDAANHWQTGFRADWGGTTQQFTLQGDAYSGNVDQVPGQREFSGANLLARWNRQLEGGSMLNVQAYLDHTERDHPGTFEEELDTIDLEVRHQFRAFSRHLIDWGGGYRRARDRVDTGTVFAFRPDDRNLDWSNVFVQDQIALTANLDLIAGVKLEHNDYTGTEVLPNLRLAWRAAPRHFLWAAASRAVRAPSRVDRDFVQPANPPFLIAGGPDFESEVAHVYEIGYRAQPLAALSFSVTAFWNEFDRLRSTEFRPGGFRFENRIEGDSVGLESWASWRVTGNWRLTGGVVVLEQDLQRTASSNDPRGAAGLGNDPEYWWHVRSLLDLTPQLQLDVAVRYVDDLPDPRVPSYTAVDARLGWRPVKPLELSITFQNLFDPDHVEWGVPNNRVEFGRAVFFRILWES
jgi:iron complex outermembrane recepter protein